MTTPQLRSTTGETTLPPPSQTTLNIGTTSAAPVEQAPSAELTGRRNGVLAMLILANTFNFMDRLILGILGGSIAKELQLSDSALGLIGAAFAVFYTGLGMPIAALADRWSRSWIMTIALTLWSGFTALCGLATGFWSLFLARLGVGIGEAGGVAPAYSLIADYFPKHQRARALAAYSFGIPLGSSVGVLFGGFVAQRVGWREAFLWVGIAGMVLAPLFRLVVKEPKRVIGAVAQAKPTIGQTLKVLLPKRSFWLLSFGAACSSIFGYGVAFWLPKFLYKAMNKNLEHVSMFYGAILFIGGLTGMWAGGWVADRFGTKKRSNYPMIPALAALTAIPWFMAAINTTSLTVSFALFLVPQALSLMWLGPVLTSIQHLVAPPMRSTASAAFLFINNLVGIGFGTYIFGAASDWLKPSLGDEAMRTVFTGGLLFYTVSALLFIRASRRLERDWVE